MMDFPTLESLAELLIREVLVYTPDLRISHLFGTTKYGQEVLDGERGSQSLRASDMIPIRDDTHVRAWFMSSRLEMSIDLLVVFEDATTESAAVSGEAGEDAGNSGGGAGGDAGGTGRE